MTRFIARKAGNKFFDILTFDVNKMMLRRCCSVLLTETTENAQLKELAEKLDCMVSEISLER
jgi:hypothetical protein